MSHYTGENTDNERREAQGAQCLQVEREILLLLRAVHFDVAEGRHRKGRKEVEWWKSTAKAPGGAEALDS